MSDQGRAAPRQGGRSGMSVSGTLSIIVAAIAVVLGFLILRDINDENGGGAAGTDTGTETPDSTFPGGDTIASTSTVTGTTAAPVLRPFTVIVANAAKMSGAAGNLTTALQQRGLTTGEPVTAQVDTPVATTTIYYTGDYQAEALKVATEMGLGPEAVTPLPSPPPTIEGDISTAQVVVYLGTDKAGATLPPASSTETSAAATETSAAG